MNMTGTWFTGYTLIDITETNVVRQSSNTTLLRQQQRNWETVLQIIGLRCQPLDILAPAHSEYASMESHQFGSYYTGFHQCWKFKFYIEHSDVYRSGNNPMFLLEQDFNEIPIIAGLLESVPLQDPVFYTNGILKNVYFEVSF
jgi:hypothetical protein